MDITIEINCEFEQTSAKVDQNKVITLPNVIGSSYDLAQAILTGYTFTSDETLCPQDRIFLYEDAKREKLIKEEGFDINDLNE